MSVAYLSFTLAGGMLGSHVAMFGMSFSGYASVPVFAGCVAAGSLFGLAHAVPTVYVVSRCRSAFETHYGLKPGNIRLGRFGTFVGAIVLLPVTYGILMYSMTTILDL